MKKFFSPKVIFEQTETYTQNYVREKSNNLSQNVDINLLLNRVKINNQKELKRKIIFICGCSSALVLFAFFIISLK
mgnify:CR=1 FL=1